MTHRRRPIGRALATVALAGCALGAGVLLPSSVALAQAPPSSAPVTLTIDASSAPPDAPVILPVSLATAEQVRVGSLSIRLPFPTATLRFERVEPSGLITAMGAAVTSEVKDGSPAGESVLHATLASPAGGAARSPLPTGPVAYLVFKIARDATPTTIALQPVATASTTDEPAQPIAPVAAASVEVTVEAPGVAACFFYMH